MSPVDKKKPGRPNKEKQNVVHEPAKVVKRGKVSWTEHQDPKPVTPKDVKTKPEPAPEPPEEEPEEDENIPDDEVGGMMDRVEEKKVEAVKKVEKTVDVQEWTRQDPVIPEALEGRVWISVFKCPAGHKTKATNRQATSGVPCSECKQPAVIMPQFLVKPTEEKRKRP